MEEKSAEHRITAEIVRKSLASEFDVPEEDVKVNRFDVTGGSNEGDGYACDIKAVSAVANVKGKPDGATYFYMAKTFPMSPKSVKFLVDSKLFVNEVAMYADLVPRMQQMEPRVSAPRTFFADSEAGVLMMENLKKLGYYIPEDKVKGLNLAEVKLVISQLALLHATSFHFLNVYEGGLEQFQKDYPTICMDNWFGRSMQGMQEMVEGLWNSIDGIIVATVKEFRSEDKELLKKVEAMTGANRKEVLDLCHTKMGMFNTIIHNDAWFNNFMYKKDPVSEEPAEIKLIDLQLSRIARPSVDLAYFFGSSTTVDLRRKHLDDLLHLYHDTLSSKLKELGYGGGAEKAYPFNELWQDYNECRIFGYVMAIFQALIHLPKGVAKEDKFSVDSTVGDDFKEAQMKFRDAHIAEAKRNTVLRERILETVDEAARVGII